MSWFCFQLPVNKLLFWNPSISSFLWVLSPSSPVHRLFTPCQKHCSFCQIVCFPLEDDLKPDYCPCWILLASWTSFGPLACVTCLCLNQFNKIVSLILLPWFWDEDSLYCGFGFVAFCSLTTFVWNIVSLTLWVLHWGFIVSVLLLLSSKATQQTSFLGLPSCASVFL